MSLFKQFGTNAAKVEEGVEIPFGANDDKTIPVFIVARQHRSNKQYRKAADAALRPYRRQIELKTLADDTAETVLMDVFVNTLLKGWRNVQDEKGREIEFSPENAKELFVALPDLYDELQTATNDASLFRDGEREADAKN